MHSNIPDRFCFKVLRGPLTPCPSSPSGPEFRAQHCSHCSADKSRRELHDRLCGGCDRIQGEARRRWSPKWPDHLPCFCLYSVTPSPQTKHGTPYNLWVFLLSAPRENALYKRGRACVSCLPLFSQIINPDHGYRADTQETFQESKSTSKFLKVMCKAPQHLVLSTPLTVLPATFFRCVQ